MKLRLTNCPGDLKRNAGPVGAAMRIMVVMMLRLLLVTIATTGMATVAVRVQVEKWGSRGIVILVILPILLLS